MQTDPIQHLLNEHQEIMAQIAELRIAVGRLRAEDPDALDEALAVYRLVGEMMATQLELHRRKEDEIFFPALEDIFGTENTPTSVMRMEHEAIHAHGELLRETLRELQEDQHPAIEASRERLLALQEAGGDAQALRAIGEEIIGLLDLHFTKEERILFPMARQLLEPDTLKEIGDQFQLLTEGGIQPPPE